MPTEQLNLMRKQNGSFLHDLHATKFCDTACQIYVVLFNCLKIISLF